MLIRQIDIFVGKLNKIKILFNFIQPGVDNQEVSFFTEDLRRAWFQIDRQRWIRRSVRVGIFHNDAISVTEIFSFYPTVLFIGR